MKFIFNKCEFSTIQVIFNSNKIERHNLVHINELHINVQYSLDTIMSVQPHKVKSLVELCTYALAIQLLLGKRELKRATSNAKKALERRANYPSSRTHLENQIMAKEEELEKLKKTVG